MSTKQYLTIVYCITDQRQVKHLLDHAEWSAASHSHAIHDCHRLRAENEALREDYEQGWIAAAMAHELLLEKAHEFIKGQI